MDVLIFGLGYTAGRWAARLRAAGARVRATGRAGDLAFDDGEGVALAIGSAGRILSSIPPDRDGYDPVLERYGRALATAPARWIGYLSSTGVYGDTGGAWVDEGAPLNGRRAGRTAADRAWQAIHPAARVFRLPGIYGPGRSALERVAAGRAHRVGLAQQVFSRIHVDDIGAALTASFDAPPGVYNLADDLPAAQDDVVAFAARLLGLPPPPRVALDALSPASRAFYAENRRVASGRARRVLGWRLAYPDFRAGLRACIATTSPTIASAPPTMASGDQR